MEHYTFELHENVERTHVRFKNRFGIELAGDLYIPKNTTGKLPALPVSGPFGAVKEQSSGLYANELASRGFIALAFDNSFTGESGGESRNIASPEMFTEDYSAAVDYLGLLKEVDREKIGVMAICGLSGMALTAATVDPRVKAVATASMYDMTNSISRGNMNSYSKEEQEKIMDYVAKERWATAENGATPGPHEVFFDENGEVVKLPFCLPPVLPEDNDNPVLASFFDYYRTPRGYHERSINSNTAWQSTTPYSFFGFDLYTNLERLNNRQVMLIAGEEAHSLYHSEVVKNRRLENTELVIVPKADHCDLYDKYEFIPFDTLEQFFKTNLK